MKTAIYEVTLMLEIKDDGTDQSEIVEEGLAAIVDARILGRRPILRQEIVDAVEFSARLVERRER